MARSRLLKLFALLVPVVVGLILAVYARPLADPGAEAARESGIDSTPAASRLTQGGNWMGHTRFFPKTIGGVVYDDGCTPSNPTAGNLVGNYDDVANMRWKIAQWVETAGNHEMVVTLWCEDAFLDFYKAHVKVTWVGENPMVQEKFATGMT